AREYVKNANQADNVQTVSAWFFPSVRLENNGYAMTVADYLQFGENLVAQGVSDGNVHMSGQEMNMLLAKAIQTRFLDTPPAQSVPDLLREKAAFLEEALPQPKRGNLRFVELGCIRRVREGVGEGKRFYGAMGLSIALSKDGVPKNEADAAMADYVSRSSGTKPFLPSEGQSTLDWVYGKSIGFSCKRMMDDGFEGPYCQTCPINWKHRRS
ncbi:MAG: hypothetical protein Q8P02_04265, partial [Candidatus Micrarchaeota archaeon]|nr:hypothetical protein [Candidatus Micrarchaeota archaeon]